MSGFTTHCEEQKCETILGVKIWQQVTLPDGIENPVNSAEKRENPVFGFVVAYEIPTIARLRKNKKFLDLLSEFLIQNNADDNKPIGLKIAGKPSQAIELIELLGANPAVSEKVSCLIRQVQNVEQLDSDSPVENSDIWNHKSIVMLESNSDPRQYEKLFRIYTLRGFHGIAFNVENTSRGQIRLAHKFNLKVMQTDISHPRQEEIALASDADEFLID